MGVGRLTDFYNVRHGNDLQVEGHLHYFSFHSLELMLTQFCGFSETDRLGCFNGPYKLPKSAGAILATRSPSLFGEVELVAYA